MVTTKGAGLNPNAKVWQEIPSHQNDIHVWTEDSPWLMSYSNPVVISDGNMEVPSPEGKGFNDSTADYASIHIEGTDQPDLSYLVFDTQFESAINGNIPMEQPLSQESLRETLKKQLEFCLSRENLSKDLYLISQMDGDHFVPIWALACMEDIKALTTDTDLILEVLRASPMVQVDETGEKVRPNHSRCIIILREVPETTPVEEVEALFKNENCPTVLSAEFAHNSNWYITFQSDLDAQQAFRYLREEVKMFQGKPIMARIKAINTFFGKNGYRNVDSNMYSQHAQPQAPYGSPVYMQQVYSPQQQFPVYPVVSPSWNPSVMPYFETPLAPFPNGGFMNGYSSPGNFKGNANTHREQGHDHIFRNTSKIRNHVKGHSMSEDVPPPSLLGSLIDGLSIPLSPQPLQTPGTQTGTTSANVSHPFFSIKDTSPNGNPSRAGWNKRSSHRSLRRKREGEHTTRPVPVMKDIEPLSPKFDLEASNFPPLPGCVDSIQGETMPEMRLSDVVRGLKVTSKLNETQQVNTTEEAVGKPESLTPGAKTAPVVPPASSASPPRKEEEAESPKRTASTSTLNGSSTTDSEETPSTCSQVVSPQAPSSTTTSDQQGSRKLSYAEVCQRLAKDPPPAQTPSPSPPATSPLQPLQEIKDNSFEECQPKCNTDKPQKPRDSRPPRQPLRSFRRANGQVKFGGAGSKIQEQQRGKVSFSQQGSKHSGKEQNIPPGSPK